MRQAFKDESLLTEKKNENPLRWGESTPDGDF